MKSNEILLKAAKRCETAVEGTNSACLESWLNTIDLLQPRDRQIYLQIPDDLDIANQPNSYHTGKKEETRPETIPEYLISGNVAVPVLASAVGINRDLPEYIENKLEPFIDILDMEYDPKHTSDYNRILRTALKLEQMYPSIHPCEDHIEWLVPKFRRKKRPVTPPVLPPAITTKEKAITINWRGLMGRGYDWLLTFTGRYICVAGGRGSKKSTSIANKLVLDFFSTDHVNVLVVRRYYSTHRDSTFSVIIRAIEQLGLKSEVSINNTTMVITRKSTGQKIKFAGLDEPEKLKSLKAERGEYSRCWVEEISEIASRNDFDILDLSIRGELPEGAFHQLYLTFNPHKPFWVKDAFFDRVDPNSASYDPEFAKSCICMHTTAACNEWLGSEYVDMLSQQPEHLRKVNLLGEWGDAGGQLVYENWEIWNPPPKYALINLEIAYEDLKIICGLDFGFTHPTAFVHCAVSLEARKIWILNEKSWYNTPLVKVANDLKNAGFTHHLIIADAAEPKSIHEMRRIHGLHRVRAARKGPDSVRYGIQFLQGFQIYVNAACTQIAAELMEYRYDEDGKLPKEGDDFVDALRYAIMSFRQ